MLGAKIECIERTDGGDEDQAGYSVPCGWTERKLIGSGQQEEKSSDDSSSGHRIGRDDGTGDGEDLGVFYT